MEISAAGLSDQGLVRANNEDAFLCDPEGGVFLVADGLGGHAGGEIASKLVAQAVAAGAPRLAQVAPGSRETADPASALVTVLESADAEVRLQATGDLAGMGSTVVALLLQGGRAFVVHAGDSRAYRRRGDRLDRLTHDHTPEEENGFGRPLGFPSRSHYITRAIGVGEPTIFTTTDFDVAPGDRFLLCSDGLTDAIADDRVATLIAEGDDPAHIARLLVESANAAGGPDNITVVVVLVRAGD